MTRPLAGLLSRGTVLLDGAMGSALIARGLSPDTPPELWNLERPDDVLSVHAGYLKAGSAVIQTNSFGGNAIRLEAHGLSDRALELNREAAHLALSAVERSRSDGTRPARALVAGNLGPCGRLLEPLGTLKPARLTEAFAEQARALASAGVDYLSIETITDLDEALCAVRGARQATALEITVCLTFEPGSPGRRGVHTIMGNSIEEAASALAVAGITAFGANCSLGSGQMSAFAGQLVAATDLPVIAKPNAGLPEIQDGKPVYRQTPEQFALDLCAMARQGVRLVGGCCGTDERFIRALHRGLRS